MNKEIVERLEQILQDHDAPLQLNYLAELLHISDDPQAERIICSAIRKINQCELCRLHNTNSCNPIGLKPGDKISEITYKFGTYLMDLYSFYAQSDRSAIWMYEEPTGIWRPSGQEFIQCFVADALGSGFKTHNASEVQSYIRYLSYNQDVTLGGCRNRMVVTNGVVDLETGDFCNDFNPDDYQITAIPVTYDPDADCPAIKKFLSEILDSEEDQKTIIEFFGYCLWKEYQYAVVLMLLGTGANGKSTLLSLLKAFLGQSSVSGCSPQELSVNRFRSAQLHGRLANIAGDIPAKPLEYTSIIKMLTGRDLITAEHKNRDPFDFENYAKLIFSANQLPAAYDDTDAFHRRFRLIDFPNKFRSGDPKTDPNILDKLTTPEELSGLLNLAIEGWQRLRDQGFLTGEKSTEEKRIDYVRRSDPLQYFATKFLEHDIHALPIEKSEVYEWYMQLCHSLKKIPVNDVWFAKRLRRVVPYINEAQITVGERRPRVWTGLKIRYDLLAEEGVSAYTGNTGNTGNTCLDPLPETVQDILGGRRENTRVTRVIRSKGYLLLVGRLADLWETTGLKHNEPLTDEHLEKAVDKGIKQPDRLLDECIAEQLVRSQHPGQYWLTELGREEVKEVVQITGTKDKKIPKFPRLKRDRSKTILRLFVSEETISNTDIQMQLAEVYGSGFEDKIAIKNIHENTHNLRALIRFDIVFSI